MIPVTHKSYIRELVVSPPRPWVVLKFGGTSVASAGRWRCIHHIVSRHRAAGARVLLVCSALAGVTNRLESLLAELEQRHPYEAALTDLLETHALLAAELGLDCDRVLGPDIAALRVLLARVDAAPRPIGAHDRAALMALGEVLSSRLGAAHLELRDEDVAWLDARTVLLTVGAGARAERFLSARCEARFDAAARARLDGLAASVVVTQGFIARDDAGCTVLLGRGGSDASAAYLAAAIGATLIEIWSDVPGMFSADPRAVRSARLLRRRSYGEAETLGALGAKVLHPRTIEPARAAAVPIRLGWTTEPDVPGSRIVGARVPRGPKAIVSRAALALFTMRRPPSWQPVGFMAAIASRFEARGLSMDLIASSSSEIRATVDLVAFPSVVGELDTLLDELSLVSRVSVTTQVACVSVVGSGVARDLARSARAAALFSDMPIHLISHAADGGHVSVVVDRADAPVLVAGLHERLIAPLDDEGTFGPTWSSLERRPPRSMVALVQGAS